MPTPNATLAAFLVEAKVNSYAAQVPDNAVAPLLPGAKQFEYKKGSFLYRDIYFGSSYFVGQETVYEGDYPKWSMVYSGGVIPSDQSPVVVKDVYRFLTSALRQVTPERPFRGPHHLQENCWAYTDHNVGNIDRFYGSECIYYEGALVYTLQYSGGSIR